jgi:hypothetical protein
VAEGIGPEFKPQYRGKKKKKKILRTRQNSQALQCRQKDLEITALSPRMEPLTDTPPGFGSNSSVEG